MQFELAAPYEMSLGQTEAVERLVKNLSEEKGRDKQTLLGITGSGKSVVADTEVAIRKNGIQLKDKIGSLIDNLFIQSRDKVRSINETEVIDASKISDVYEAYSINPASKKSEWKKIRQFIRHRAPEKLYRVKSRCGREVVVTGNHNFFVLRNGELKLLETADLREEDFLPVPREIEEPAEPLTCISIEDSHITEELKLFASVPNLASVLEANREKITSLISYHKLYNVLNSNERVPYGTYKKLISAVDPVCGQGAKFGLRYGSKSLPLNIPITDDFLRLLGYYIAEGHSEKEYFLLCSGNEEIISDFAMTLSKLEIHMSKRPETYDFVGYSTFYSTLLKNWCGKDSGSKHLPDFWMQLSNKQLANLLRAYFSGDGGVNQNSVSCTTKSKQLASDIAYSLLRFGIVTRTRKRMMCLPGKSIRMPYFEIGISGRKYLKIFQSEIGFIPKAKNEALEKIIADFGNTNVDIIPANSLITKIRKDLKVFQRELSDLAGIEPSYVCMIESGRRMPSREVTRKIISSFYSLAKQKNRNDVVLEDIRKLENLLEVFWSPVSKVQLVEGEKYVYDFSVEDNETFLAGHGGIFVHNTFVMANLINRYQKPTLIIAHNKTLAAQLYTELKELFPNNRVEYFISFYDYYQPESYLPTTDTYIEKDSSINDQIEKMRMHAVSSIVSRNDTIIVASISCIYGLGNPDYYKELAIQLETGKQTRRQDLIRSLINIQYERNDQALEPGRFRVRGDTIDIIPAYEEDVLRIELENNQIKKIKEVDALTGNTKNTTIDKVTVYPARQYVVPEEKQKQALKQITEELEDQFPKLPPLEAQRLKQRTNYDLEMIREMGFCSGIENYSRHFDGREAGKPPFVLMDYFPKDFLLIIDESHQTIPQSRAMYNGDYARKKNLVDFGFRLPSAFDNRPLKFEEFEKKMGKTVFVSATPAEYELEKSGSAVELITRPTGLLDPEVELHPIEGQMKHLIKEARKTIENGNRVLITTLTKKMAEDLTDYLVKEGFKTRYLHSDIESLDRIELIRQLRSGEFDILVGINLLREGLDLPEVATILILDADKEGFLRDERSLIQTFGRAARNVDGKVILYADKKTRSITRAVEITRYRRRFQIRFNQEHDITPTTIVKKVAEKQREIKGVKHLAKSDIEKQIITLEAKMKEYAEKLDFEKAIQIRDTIAEMQNHLSDKQQKSALD